MYIVIAAAANIFVFGLVSLLYQTDSAEVKLRFFFLLLSNFLFLLHDALNVLEIAR